MSKACFISDLHLDNSVPELKQAFIYFLNNPPEPIDSLYILGDLFEAWVGDDAADYNQEPLSCLTTFAKHTPVYFTHGNRDFLVGETFSNRTHVQLLDEQQVLKSGDKHVLIMHGDELCTDDTDYQQFRHLVRNPLWQEDFLNKSIEERNAIAQQLRQTSKTSSMQKSEDIMDVNQEAVFQALQDWNAEILIHGHTHRPGVHSVGDKKRVVLGDWGEHLWYAIVENGDVRLESRPIK